MPDSRVLDLQSGCISKRITQLKQCDIRVLGDQLFEKTNMGCQFPRPFWTTLYGRISPARRLDLMPPSGARCWR